MSTPRPNLDAATAATGASRADDPRSAHTVVPVIEETLEIRREREAIGSVRIRKEVHHDEVPVVGTHVRETVHTERVSVNRPVEAMRAPWETEDALVIPVYEERMVRQLFLTEELHVRRQRQSVEESDSVVLRREEVVVERLDPETQTWVRQALPPRL